MTTPPPSAPTAPSASRTSFTFKAAFFAIPLVILFAIVGVIFHVGVRRVALVEKQLKLQKEREKNLAGVAPQHAEYLRLLKALDTRFNTLQMLVYCRTGPGELMRAVGKLATQNADVDLTSLASENGRWVFRGRARSVQSAAAFLASLPSKGFSDVQLRAFYQDGGHNSTTYHFEFDCRTNL
jgi:hypothetical protein